MWLIWLQALSVKKCMLRTANLCMQGNWRVRHGVHLKQKRKLMLHLCRMHCAWRSTGEV